MDPASFVFGALGVIVELYRVSMATYDLYLSIQDFTPAFRRLRLALEIERKRLELWAQSMGIDQGAGIDERLHNDQGLLEILKGILINMKESLEDSSKLLVEYQDAQSPSAASGSGQSKYITSKLYQGSAIVTLATEPELPRRISPGTRKTLENYGRVVKWATRDKKKLEQLVKALNKYNTDLDHLASNYQQASLRRSLRTQFLAPEIHEDLLLLQETAVMIGHDELRHVASSKAFVKEVYRSEDLCDALNAAQLKEVVTSDKEMSNSLDSWRLDFGRLQYDGVAILNNHSRTVGTYRHGHGESDAVIVDWTKCQDDSWRRRNPEAFEIRVSSLARVLNRDLLPKGFRVLQCIGYLNASSTTIGYMFRTPMHAAPHSEPVSLHQILSDVNGPADIPELGTRFDLAKAIATTIFEFHNIGWLHKNIHPKNILFWPSKDHDEAPDLRAPYLVGFDLSRSTQPGDVSEKPVAAEEEDLYRHPAYKGPDATGFKPSYDYYSLGILLFEIAMWRLVSFKRDRRASSTSSKDKGRQHTNFSDPDFIEKTVADAAQDLGRYIGRRYRDAVLFAIKMEFDGIYDALGEDERDLALQKAVQSKVIDAVDFCQA